MARAGCTLCTSLPDMGLGVCPIRGKPAFRSRAEAHDAAERGCAAGVASRAAYRAWDTMGRKGTSTTQRKDSTASPISVPSFATDYRLANEAVQSRVRDPFEIDPSAVDRGNIGHAKTQNDLAALVRQRGLKPLSSEPQGPDFDLAWIDGEVLCVAEVKSLTRSNEDRQLRLGLGQVLDYQYLVEKTGWSTRAILAVEREPRDLRWVALAERHGVSLVWPATFSRLFQVA